MSLLTAADLVFMRDTQEEALPGTVVIERYALTSDGQGGKHEAWTAAGTVEGRISYKERRGQGETVGGAQLLSETHWVATLPTGTVVYAQDRLFKDGVTWEVQQVNNGQDYKTAVRCELQKTNEERRA